MTAAAGAWRTAETFRHFETFRVYIPHSKPAGPLPQGTLSLGGSFSFRGGRGVSRNQPKADLGNRATVAVLTICRHCLGCVAPQSRWLARSRALEDEYPAIPRLDMGFPTNWADCPIWRGVGHDE